MLTLLLAAASLITQTPGFTLDAFHQDMTRSLTVKDGLPSNEVLSVVASGRAMWIATSAGVLYKPVGQAIPETQQVVFREPVIHLGAMPDGGVIATTKKGFYLLAPGKSARLIEGVSGTTVCSVPATKGVWLLTTDADYLWDNGLRTKRDAPPDTQWAFGFPAGDRAIFCARVVTAGFSSGERGVGTSYLYRLFFADDSKRVDLAAQKDVRGRLRSSDFRGGCTDGSGHIWMATQEGAALSDGKGWWQAITGREGLPFEDTTCITSSPNGDLWVGTSDGACRLRDGQWSYFGGKRWLPSNKVSSIAVDVGGNAWLGTDKGVAVIDSRLISLSEKAAHYEDITAKRHNRNGYVTVSRMTDPETFGGNQHEASDNDGIWSGMYGAAESFRWAVTKDPDAKRLAQKTLRAMLDLERLSGIPGFPARAVIKDGEPNVYESTGEWHRSTVDPTYRWKGDTSSDELDGHYFFYPIYYDLVADEKEKEEIRGLMRRMTDHLLKNDYRLIDLDGKPTRWAVYGPKQLNDDPFWEEQRCLNSLSILKNLMVAYHITGEKRYLAAYEDLIKNHHYLINAINQKQVPPVEINHSDDQLAFFSYYALLRYETNAERLRQLKISLERSWQIERPERNPFFNFIYGAVTGKPCDVEASVETLQQWPWDLRHWDVKNSHRTDVQFSALSRFDRQELTRVLPANEARSYQWSDNPYLADGGDGGKTEYDGAAWLLAYWLGRYHKIIVQP
jgi:hypothetical protein